LAVNPPLDKSLTVDAHRLLGSIKKIDNDMSHCEKPLPNESIFHSMRFEETFGMD
jgi:hypothetical protein